MIALQPLADETRPRRHTRLLFVARAYPPTTGGMEMCAHHLHKELSDIADVTAMINHRGKRALPAFLPYAALAGIAAVKRHRIDAVYLADALLAPAGAAIKAATGVPVIATVHGLDVTYDNAVYQRTAIPALRRLDAVMPNSNATRGALHGRTGARPPSTVVPLGVNPVPPPSRDAARAFERMLDVRPEQPVVLTVGRLIERKGAAWFAAEVLPQLPDDLIYAVVGEGAQREAILAAATAAGVAHRVRVLGRVDDDMLAAAYERADIFVMPNIPVAGDIEGFGLVALEAAASRVPVIASRIDGIVDAVRDGKNGLLVDPLNAAAFAREIRALLAMPAYERAALAASFSACTLETYGWPRAARRYLDLIEQLLDQRAVSQSRAA